MAGRGRGNDNRNRNDDLDIGDVLLGLGSLALAGGAIYAATRAFSGGDEETLQPQQSSYSSYSQRQTRRSEDPTITIAVDATPTRAGGLLVLPSQEQVYFYSIDWSDKFSFGGEPDKFEMVNALLALNIFEEYVERYRRGAPVVLKTDNNFCINPSTVYAGQRNAEWRALFNKTDEMLRTDPFEGRWIYCGRTSDVHIRVADKLSRADHSWSSSLPQMGDMSSPFLRYEKENISNGQGRVLSKVARLVPRSVRCSEEPEQGCAQT